MDQNSAALFELQETIRFFGSLVGTPGLTEENNKLANDIVNKALVAITPLVEERTKVVRATAAGIITA